jgi:hypothetical protein
MKFGTKQLWFASFTAVYAVLVAFIFWGTWSLSAAPVMPDCPIWHPLAFGDNVAKYCRDWLATGRFVPGDILRFIGTPYVWQEAQYALAGYFAALGLAYFLKGRGLSRLASYGGGLLLALSGYWFSLFSAGHVGWFQWMTYGVFAFGLCDRAVRRGKWRHWILLGATVAWGSFYQPDLWLLFTVFTGVYFVWCCIRERHWPNFKGVALAALSFFVIGGVSFYHAFTDALAGRDQQITESKTAAQTDDDARWIFTTNWSMPPEDTLEFFIPRIHGDTSCPMTQAFGRRAGKDVKPYTGRLGRPLNARAGNYRQHSLYCGFVTCLLALVGLAFSFKNRRTDALFFAAAALIFWLFSMGRFCEPIYRIVYALPFGDYLRAPVKWHHLTELCLAVLAAFGIDALARRIPHGTPILAVLVLLGAADLARINKLYCAPIDLSIIRAPNAPAADILKHGNGLTVDFLEGGNGLTAWSFAARNIPMTGNFNDPAIRYIWLSLEQLKANPQLSAWLKSKNAHPLGTYSLTQQAIRPAANGRGANTALYMIDAAPTSSTAAPFPRPKPLSLALAILSFIGTFSAALFSICSLTKKEASYA